LAQAVDSTSDKASTFGA
jgi:hypothetical protein